jgi:hypothetical protein
MVVAAVVASISFMVLVIIACRIAIDWNIREERREIRRADNERAVKWEDFAADHKTGFEDAYNEHYGKREDA